MNEKKAAVYHFTDKSQKRPKVCRDQLNSLKNHAFSLGFSDVDVFCDKSLRRCDRVEFDRFLENSDQYSALITKDFYHIAKNTGKCMKTMTDLRKNGITIYTLENGTFLWDDVPVDKPLSVATYTCHLGLADEQKEIVSVRNDILSLFAKKKTEWTIKHQYYDDSPRQKDGEQVQLRELMDKKDEYDLLLVHNLNDIHWRTANLCKIREKLQMDIYSLQEGLLKFGKEALV